MPHFESTTDLIIMSSHKYGSEEVRTSKLMSEFAQKRKVFFIESPIIGVSDYSTYILKKETDAVTLVQPYLPKEISVFEKMAAHLAIIKELLVDENISHYSFWTDTPKSMPFIRSLGPEIIIYDCQNDYSSTNPELEKELFQYADVVLTSALKSVVPAMEIKSAAGQNYTRPATNVTRLSMVNF